MNKIVIGLLAFVGLAIVAVIIFASVVWNQRGVLVKGNNQIEAQYQANKSDYDKMWKSFVEMTQVTELQASQFKDVYTDLIAGRNNDTKLLVKMVKESNPQLGTSVYNDLLRHIAANREEFSHNQKTILDMINQYNNNVEQDCIIAATIFNKEKKDGSKYIITSAKTDNAFKSGQDDAINLNGK